MAQKFNSYPGTRDFYPEEMALRQRLFAVQREVCESYGYQEYAAPVLESIQLYRQKSSEEIVNEQLYSFFDRGEREVAIRPEMTPTVARMVAARSGQLNRPLRWYSIANFMRYERPGKGRLREFYQLNVDLIGLAGLAADAEILAMAGKLMQSYGATPDLYTIRINDRSLLDSYFQDFSVDLKLLGRLLDKREKIGAETFVSELEKLGLKPAQVDRVHSYLSLDVKALTALDFPAARALTELLTFLQDLPFAAAVRFDPGIVRGFDYYTGLIFEVNDNHPENRRALFGGGRYDKLMAQLGGPDWVAVGFGMGDVTLEQFLTSHALLPEQEHRPGFYFACLDPNTHAENFRLAEAWRSSVPIEMAGPEKGKFGKQLELAEKKGYRFVLLRGSAEKDLGQVALKDLQTGEQETFPEAQAKEQLKARWLTC